MIRENAADSAPNTIIPYVLGSTVLFAAGNQDHNLITLDGKGTYHRMGMVAALTPGREVSQIIFRKPTSKISITEKSTSAN